MRRTSLLLLCVCAVVSIAGAQVLPPNEIQDPELRGCKSATWTSLKQLGAAILAMPTDYPFYLSRKLDLDKDKQKWADQRSIQFDRYKDKVVLKITGNYFAAYSAVTMNSDQRARQTFLQIVLPILQAAAPQFQKNTGYPGLCLRNLAPCVRESWRSSGRAARECGGDHSAGCGHPDGGSER